MLIAPISGETGDGWLGFTRRSRYKSQTSNPFEDLKYQVPAVFWLCTTFRDLPRQQIEPEFSVISISFPYHLENDELDPDERMNGWMDDEWMMNWIPGIRWIGKAWWIRWWIRWQFMHGLFELLLRERPEDPYEFMVPWCRRIEVESKSKRNVETTLDLPRPNALARQPRWRRQLCWKLWAFQFFQMLKVEDGWRWLKIEHVEHVERNWRLKMGHVDHGSHSMCRRLPLRPGSDTGKGLVPAWCRHGPGPCGSSGGPFSISPFSPMIRSVILSGKISCALAQQICPINQCSDLHLILMILPDQFLPDQFSAGFPWNCHGVKIWSSAADLSEFRFNGHTQMGTQCGLSMDFAGHGTHWFLGFTSFQFLSRSRFGNSEVLSSQMETQCFTASHHQVMDRMDRVRLCVDEPFFNVSFAGFTSHSVRDLPQNIAGRTSNKKCRIQNRI